MTTLNSGDAGESCSLWVMVRSIFQKTHLEHFRISHSTLKSKFASGYSDYEVWSRILVAAKSAGHSVPSGWVESAVPNDTDSDRRLA